MYRRHLFLVAVAYLASGCQSDRPAAPPARAALDPVHECEAVTASALVFDPPVVRDEPPLMLSRAERAPGVVVGYDEGVVEYFSIRLDDRQISDGFHGRSGSGHGGGGGVYDRYERRAVTERVGVRYR